MRTSVMMLIGMMLAIKQYEMHGRSWAWRHSEKRVVIFKCFCFLHVLIHFLVRYN